MAAGAVVAVKSARSVGIKVFLSVGVSLCLTSVAFADETDSLEAILSGAVESPETVAVEDGAMELELESRLLPGRVLSEREMSSFYGRGVTPGLSISRNVTAGDDSIINANETTTAEQLITQDQTRGISNVVTNVGDFSTTTIDIDINVNIGTVEVHSEAGSEVTVNQTLDLGGGVVQALGSD